jgi:putative sigma-54 modulation protein
VEGKNVEITEAIRDYAESKVARIQKHFDSLIQNHNIRTVLKVLNNRKGKNQKAEITINLKGGHVIRCESAEDSMYASIDMVVDKIEGQLRKYKTRIYSKIHSGKSVKDYGIEEINTDAVPIELIEHVHEDRNHQKIIKVKRFPMQPLDPETAIEKLDDSGHPFYMFLNIYSNSIACVYKREEGGYGIIEPENIAVV